MELKSDKSAFYVFISKDMLYEIVVEVGKGVKRINHLPNDRIVSGTGRTYIRDLKLLENLRKRKCKKVHNTLSKTFKQAHSQMRFLSGSEFSGRYKIYQLVN